VAVGSGRSDKVGIAKEATRGTVVTPAYWLPQTTIDFQNKNKQVMEDSVFGVLSKYQRTDIVEQWAEGKIEGLVGDASFGLIMLAAMGTLASHSAHSGETIVYDNIFSASQSNTPQSLTITRKDNTTDYNYARGMLKSLELNVAVGEYVKYTSDWVAIMGVAGTDTPAYSLENRFRPKHAVVKMATTLSGLAGATAIPVKNFKITITRTINPYYVVGSNAPTEIYVEDFTVKGDFTLIYTDSTYETPFYANTQEALSLTLANTDVTIGSSTNPTLSLTLPQTTLSTWSISQDKDKIMEQTVGFQGQYNLANSEEITSTLTNLVNGY
jgi:hypothetical protein